jgi:hypothetical protein
MPWNDYPKERSDNAKKALKHREETIPIAEPLSVGNGANFGEA